MLTARKVSFDLSGNISKHWLNEDPVKSHFLNAFSVVLPAYEQFFIRTIHRSRDWISDPVLQANIKGFCAQEGSHASEHRKYNQLLVRQGYAAIPKFEKLLYGFLGWVEKKTPLPWLLACTAGGEHVTAFMGEDFLGDPEKWSRNSDPQLDALWKWHAFEEIEHKAVCFDVYQHVSGNGLRRCLALLLISIPTLAMVTALQFYLLGKDRLLTEPTIWRNYIFFMVGKKGYLRNLVKQYSLYFHRDFYPG